MVKNINLQSMQFRKTFAEVDLTALENNFLNLAAALKSSNGAICSMAPVVKGDAYGHGDIEVAQVCERLGAKYLCVSLIEEGIRLRLAGIRMPILVFGIFDSIGAEAIIQFQLTPVLSHFDQIKKLKLALGPQAKYPVHLKFNTGMQRLGFEPENARSLATVFANQEHLVIEGLCTHFAASENFVQPDGSAREQIKIFEKINGDFKDTLKSPVLLHYMNSAAILGDMTPKLDLARPGLALYGAYPKMLVKPIAEVEPVMSFKSTIVFIRNVKKAAKVSYEGLWEAPRDSVIGVVPMGAADGVPRLLANRGQVLVRGQRCPIVGAVCMDYVMIDLTQLAQQQTSLIDEEVVLFGKQAGAIIRVEEVAEWAHLSDEIFAGIPSRLPRFYLNQKSKIKVA